MAINHRRGKIGDFDPNKMTTAEWAFPDDGTARYCVAPGNVKTVATKEELQEILTSSPEAYQALLQLINDLEDNPSEFTNILNSIADLQANKINKSNIIQTDTISNPTKVPSSVVTEALGKEIDTITNNLAEQVIVQTATADETLRISLSPYKSGSTFLLPYGSVNINYNGLYVIIKLGSTALKIFPLITAPSITVASEGVDVLVTPSTYNSTVRLIHLTAFMQ